MKKTSIGLAISLFTLSASANSFCLVNLKEMYKDNFKIAKIIDVGLTEKGYTITNMEGSFSVFSNYRYSRNLGSKHQTFSLFLKGSCNDQSISFGKDSPVKETIVGYVGEKKAAREFVESIPMCPCLN